MRDPLLPLFRMTAAVGEIGPTLGSSRLVVLFLMAFFGGVVGAVALTFNLVAPDFGISHFVQDRWPEIIFGLIGVFLVYFLGRAFYESFSESTEESRAAAEAQRSKLNG